MLLNHVYTFSLFYYTIIPTKQDQKKRFALRQIQQKRAMIVKSGTDCRK